MKRCARCNVQFGRRKAESNYAFERRAYCSSRCENAARNAALNSQKRNTAEIVWAAAKAHFGLGGVR